MKSTRSSFLFNCTLTLTLLGAAAGLMFSQSGQPAADTKNKQVDVKGFGKQKPPEDFVYRYDLDPFSSLERTQLLSNKDADSMKQRLCNFHPR